MAFTGALFKISGKTLDLDEKGFESLLARNSGVSFEQLQNKAILEMVANPATELGKYDTAVNAAITAEGLQMVKDFEQLQKLGLPEEKVKEIVLGKAQRRLADTIQILKYSYPLAGDMDILASAAAKAGTQIHVSARKKISN